MLLLQLSLRRGLNLTIPTSTITGTVHFPPNTPQTDRQPCCMCCVRGEAEQQGEGKDKGGDLLALALLVLTGLESPRVSRSGVCHPALISEPSVPLFYDSSIP